jgi:hypothetical protein
MTNQVIIVDKIPVFIKPGLERRREKVVLIADDTYFNIFTARNLIKKYFGENIKFYEVSINLKF